MYIDKQSLVIEYVKTKNPELKEKILLSYVPLVKYIVNKICFDRRDFEDLYQIGSIGLLRALDRFDPKKEVNFSTYATPTVIGEIKHYFRDKKNIIKLPRKLQSNYSSIRRYVSQAQKDGKSPTVSEIATALDLSDEHVLEALEANEYTSTVSLDAPVSSSDGGRFESKNTLLDNLGVDSTEENQLDKVMLKQALKKLEKREKRIIILRYYSGLSQAEIAEKMNLSQMHISRLLSKSITNLKKHFTSIQA